MKYFFANWKMYLKEPEALALAEQLRSAKLPEDLTVSAFPSALHVDAVSKALGQVPFGVQDIGGAEYGAETGEISAVEAKQYGATYALVGHSERRKAGESDELVAKKFATALEAGLIPVLCVGETLEERKLGKQAEVVRRQLKSALSSFLFSLPKKFLIAYEPVWAIGTGIAAKPDEIEEMHKLIRKETAAPILYGGSVTSENVREFLALPDVDGVLVGGASAKVKELSGLLDVLCS